MIYKHDMFIILEIQCDFVVALYFASPLQFLPFQRYNITDSQFELF